MKGYKAKDIYDKYIYVSLLLLIAVTISILLVPTFKYFLKRLCVKFPIMSFVSKNLDSIFYFFYILAFMRTSTT